MRFALFTPILEPSGHMRFAYLYHVTHKNESPVRVPRPEPRRLRTTPGTPRAFLFNARIRYWRGVYYIIRSAAVCARGVVARDSRARSGDQSHVCVIVPGETVRGEREREEWKRTGDDGKRKSRETSGSGSEHGDGCRAEEFTDEKKKKEKATSAVFGLFLRPRCVFFSSVFSTPFRDYSTETNKLLRAMTLRRRACAKRDANNRSRSAGHIGAIYIKRYAESHVRACERNERRNSRVERG